MASQYLLMLMFIMTHNMVLNCASAAVHSPSENMERESDGSYRPRDFDHYGDSGHNAEFDHEAILGSVKEAEEYEKLSTEEAQARLSQLLLKMDLNADQHIDRTELRKWILNSFRSLAKEEAGERMLDADYNRDGELSWSEYLRDTFGVDTEKEIKADDTETTGLLVVEERQMWDAADENGDGTLNHKEFEVFVNPEEHESMHSYLVKQTLREKDKNGDGKIDFVEYLGERGLQQDESWVVAERDKFENELDLNKDALLDDKEIQAWVVPDHDEIADEEVEHLFSSADDDQDGRLSFAEVLAHHETFVGSEADLGDNVHTFDDEL